MTCNLIILVVVTLIMIPNLVLSIDDPSLGDFELLIDDLGLVILNE